MHNCLRKSPVEIFDVPCMLLGWTCEHTKTSQLHPATNLCSLTDSWLLRKLEIHTHDPELHSNTTKPAPCLKLIARRGSDMLVTRQQTHRWRFPGTRLPLSTPAICVLVAWRLKWWPPRQKLVTQHTEAPVVHTRVVSHMKHRHF